MYLLLIAFAIADGGSRRITQSQVLPLTISLLEEALRRTRQMNQAQVGAWLLAKMQAHAHPRAELRKYCLPRPDKSILSQVRHPRW